MLAEQAWKTNHDTERDVWSDGFLPYDARRDPEAKSEAEYTAMIGSADSQGRKHAYDTEVDASEIDHEDL